MFDSNKIRKDFPILKRLIHGKPLAYLDNASTTQKPEAVIGAVADFYRIHNANIHRGIHTLSEEATELYEQSRAKTAEFINAKSAEEIIFTRNTTESLNLAAVGLADKVKNGDNIVITEMEHHSNMLPWRQLALKKGAELRVIPISGAGEIDVKSLNKIIDGKSKIVAFTLMSNVLGTIVPGKKIMEVAKAHGAVTVVDGAQSVPHLLTDVQNLECDFLAFSGHKMLGPTGVGVLYGRRELLENMEPVLFGGEMVKFASRERVEWSDLPWKFEAGTPNIADVVAFKTALEYLQKTGMKNVMEHDRGLYEYALGKLEALRNVDIYGPRDPDKASAIISFNVRGVHPHDTGTILDEAGVAIRAGHHCCQPLMRDLGVNGTARMSFYIYNTKDEIDRAVDAVKQVCKIFKV
jgi:cysteine desulfurase / selenocysteine lyase